jgi:hypothetical protein
MTMPAEGAEEEPSAPEDVATAEPEEVVPPPTAEPLDPAEIVARELAQLETGRILYNPPDEMRVAETERVEARITRDMGIPLNEGLSGSGTPREEEIPVTTFMTVRLTGNNFDILPLSSNEQVVAGDLPTSWAWDVTPRASGEQRLMLIVTARVKLAGYPDEQKDLTVIERPIAVQVNPVYSARAFVSENREWIVSAVLIPLLLTAGGWVWQRTRRRSER